MPEPTTPNALYQIDECPYLMADGCVADEQGNLVFLSVWARDTAIQQFLARLTLGPDEQGLEQFHLLTERGASVPVFVGQADRFDKRSTRAYRRTLFGSLVNLWLFDRRCVRPDKANASALALLPRNCAAQGIARLGRWCARPVRCRCSTTGAASFSICCRRGKCSAVCHCALVPWRGTGWRLMCRY